MKKFAAIPRQLYANDPEFISHLDQDIYDVFDRSKNSLFNRGNAKCWILEDENGNVAGRIAAFYSEESLKTGFGGIGFFECIPNQDAAFLLLNQAGDWLAANGLVGMDGPINFGERDKYWGLLVHGFSSPSYQENYSPPYYRAFFEDYGFTRIFEQTTSEVSKDSFKIDRFNRLSQRVFSNPDYTFEHYRASELEKFAEDFVTIYNKAWALRSDFSPISIQRVKETLNSIKPILIEKAIWFVYAKEKPVGFYINVLDVNQIFKYVNGKMNLVGKIRFLYHLHFGKIDRFRGIVFGIVPEYQNLGLETGLIMKCYEAMMTEGNFTRSELSWIGDFNPKMRRLFEALGAKTTKIHYTYRKTF